MSTRVKKKLQPNEASVKTDEILKRMQEINEVNYKVGQHLELGEQEAEPEEGEGLVSALDQLENDMIGIDQPEEAPEENPQLPAEEYEGYDSAVKGLPVSQAGATNVSSKTIIVTL